jgi:hypothetical protein
VELAITLASVAVLSIDQFLLSFTALADLHPSHDPGVTSQPTCKAFIAHTLTKSFHCTKIDTGEPRTGSNLFVQISMRVASHISRVGEMRSGRLACTLCLSPPREEAKSR